MATFGVIGAGAIGSALARAAITQNWHVVVSNSRGPETLARLVAELGPLARAATPIEAAEAADLVAVGIPLGAIPSMPGEALAGRVVIDPNNYYPARDGRIAALEDGSATVSELLQAQLPGSKVVKAFNHIHAAHVSDHARPAGSHPRRAMAIAGDDDGAKELVTEFTDSIGFDVVDLGALAEGWKTQRDGIDYVGFIDAATVRRVAAAAVR